MISNLMYICMCRLHKVGGCIIDSVLNPTQSCRDQTVSGGGQVFNCNGYIVTMCK